jgi:tetratricopeptide (TPR) repeat protein
MTAIIRPSPGRLVVALLGLVFSTFCVFVHCQTRGAEFEAYVAKAARAQSAGDLQMAISAYQSALTIRPNIAELWSNLGLMQHQLGDSTGALTSFANAHRLQPKLFVPILFLGLENLETGKPKQAVSYLQQAAQLNPNDPNVPAYLGRAFFAAKEFEFAAAAYLRSTQLNPKDGDAWYRLGLSHLEAAEVDSKSLATLNRQSPFFRALEADSLSSQDKLDRAAKTYEEVLESRLRPPCVRSALGFVLLRENRAADADAQFQKDLQSRGCSIARLGLLRIAFERDKANLDLAPLERLWRADSGFVDTYLPQLGVGLTPEQFSLLDKTLDQTSSTDLTPEEAARLKAALHGATGIPAATAMMKVSAEANKQARSFYSHGEYRECTDSLLPAIETLRRDALSLLAACSLFTGDFSKALMAAARLRHFPGSEDESLYWAIRAHQSLGVRSLVRAGQAEPDSIRLHELLAETYRDMGRYESAETEYATALSIDANSFPALLGSAANYLQQYRLEPASEMISRALTRKPSDPEANYIAGEILIDQHQFDKAESHLRIGLSAKAELIPRVHALLGRVYATEGKDTQAIEELKLGLASDDDGSIHFQLGRLYQKAGQQGLAEAAFEETRRLQSKRQ